MLPVNNSYGQSMAASAMSTNQRLLQLSLEKIATGVRINRAEDDAAGLMQRDRMAAQLLGMEEGMMNIQQSTGMAQVAEEGMNQMTDSLQRVRTLAVRAADSSVSDAEREGIQEEVDLLMRGINQRASQTTYNGINLFDGQVSQPTRAQQASATVQTNAMLQNGGKLFEIALENPGNANTPGAVSQGTYEVKLVANADNPQQTDAQITFTDGSSPPALVATLADVSGGEKTYTGGGITLKVNQASVSDAGLTGYAKTLGYVAADAGGKMLQVQTGANEGQTASWGPVRLDASSLFRGSPEQVSVRTPTQAQNLIGQVDDALQKIGRANAQVGTFTNELYRTLDLQRANHSSVLGGYSAINDSNLAAEATRNTMASIQNQAAAAVLAQANTSSQYILKLFQ
jgi:flagellin